MVKQALSQCPSTKVVTSGYSQGGMVVHNAFSSQGLTSQEVVAAVLFGDPFNGREVGDLPSDKTKQFCASGDSICSGGGLGGFGGSSGSSGSSGASGASGLSGLSGFGGFGKRQSGHLSYGGNADEAADWIIATLNLA